jgi:hypothetical protein
MKISTILMIISLPVALAATGAVAQGGGKGSGPGGGAGMGPGARQMQQGGMDQKQTMSQDRKQQQAKEQAQQQSRQQDQSRSQVHRDSDGQPIYGEQLMSQQEREQYSERIRSAGTQEERARIREEHRREISTRAEKQGVSIPDA